MKQMHCTYSELREQPKAALEVFRAFIRGEAEAEKIRSAPQSTPSPPGGVGG